MASKIFTSYFLSLILFFCIQGISYAGTVNYTYDELNRLVRVEYSSGMTIEYTYDASGNRLTKEVTSTDSDNDGLSDVLENSTCTDPNDADSDEDGILDGWEDVNQNGVWDDGETHPCRIDTDGDGIQDGTELGYTISDISGDTDTSIFQPDLDPSTTTDPLDSDTDGDGLSDGEEDANQNGIVDEGETDPNVNKKAMPWLMLLLSD